MKSQTLIPCIIIVNHNNTVFQFNFLSPLQKFINFNFYTRAIKHIFTQSQMDLMKASWKIPR